MSNIINDTWPVGHKFTVAFEVVEEGAAGYFMGLMKKQTVVFGCKVKRIDLEDTSGNFDEKLDKIKALVAELEQGV